MGKQNMGSKYSDRDLARAFVVLSTALQKSGCVDRVREFVPVVREEVIALAQGIGSNDHLDESFSAVYDTLREQL